MTKSRSVLQPRRWIPRVPLPVAGKVLLWAGSLAAIPFGLNAADAYARRAAVESTIELRWVNLPYWLANGDQDDVLDEIKSGIKLYSDDNIFAPDLCERVGRSVAASPWVRSVQSVSKHRDGVVRVKARFRTPLTLILVGEDAYLVDREGVRLPRGGPFNPADWIIVTGVRGPVPKVGRAWNGQDAAAALKLVELLTERAARGELSCRDELRAVDVSNYRGRESAYDGWLQIRTTVGEAMIQWGLPPGEEYGIESSAEKKLARLDELARTKYGRLPDLGKIDIRGNDRVTIERP